MPAPFVIASLPAADVAISPNLSLRAQRGNLVVESNHPTTERSRDRPQLMRTRFVIASETWQSRWLAEILSLTRLPRSTRNDILGKVDTREPRY